MPSFYVFVTLLLAIGPSVVSRGTFCASVNVEQAMYALDATDYVMDKADYVLGSYTLPLVHCAYQCNRNPTCASFSYYNTSNLCILANLAASVKVTSLKAQLSSISGWSYYKQLLMPALLNQDPCASSPCTGGKVCLRYEQPFMYKYNYNLRQYICSGHSYFVQQFIEGNTKCHFEILYDTDYVPGSVYAGKMANFDDIISLCETYDCAAFLIAFSYDEFHVKSQSHLTSTTSLITLSGVYYFFGVCSQP